MKKLHALTISVSILSLLFLSSCEEPANKIVGLWRAESLQQTAYENEELKAEATRYYLDDEVMHWEFQALEMLAFEGREMELEQTYTWVIEDDVKLFLSRENRDDEEFEITSLTRNELVLMATEYDTDGDKLILVEIVYTFSRVDE